ncbi:MAG: ergothioneine biosynthesis protein EgtB [Planctomycetes bacterium]|nr:ergothioneine biosynthesis protein EgtB [Planctomycetota bacterium]
MKTVTKPKEPILQRYLHTRSTTLDLCSSLQTEDFVVQSMPNVSPTKWHLAHTTWFFETFILKKYLSNYSPYHPLYHYLFNSYYMTLGKPFNRPDRGLLSRPAVKEILDYRRHTNELMEKLLTQCPENEAHDIFYLTEIGIHHEQQHQELLLTDIKHVLSCNPLNPEYSTGQAPAPDTIPEMRWFSYEGGLSWIGFEGEGFAYDNESPRHQVYINPFELASRLVTNREFQRFIADDGYRRPELWLSDGWNEIRRQGWEAPLYWRKESGTWKVFTLTGLRELCPDEPVCHVSFYEADAYARWAQARLPTEQEWERAARDIEIKGNFMETGVYHPRAAEAEGDGAGPVQVFGDLWEWTASPYVPYPGYKPVDGALGEYNGKFMANQFVIRGGSCATALSHIRPTYRNFFYPPSRWQFTGVRLAR